MRDFFIQYANIGRELPLLSARRRDVYELDFKARRLSPTW